MSADPRAEYERAVDLFATGRKDEAIGVLRDLIGAHPSYADAYETIGMMLYKTGKIDEAIEWTLRLCEVDPASAMARTNLSVFYMRKGLKEKAEEQKALAAVLRFGSTPPKGRT
ncbi:MAG: hypothetical protein MOGMAGMI_02058 [Candidatus Omnitrophica bacterium]|nr:hypothetical protein [Candidatus Omnitrophota bacterium]